MTSRRQFVLTVSYAALASQARAQQQQTMSGPMQQDAYRAVKLTPKASEPSMSDESRDDLEHRIKCQCGCVLDVFTCRTTDFSCAVSPAMHADVMALVAGGYNATEILNAFQSVYGERVLMAPLRQGFNLLGYILPFAVLLTGGAVVAVMIRRWGARAASAPNAPTVEIDATPEELADVQSAVREDR